MLAPQHRVFARFLCLVAAIGVVRISMAQPEPTKTPAKTSELPDAQKRVKEDFRSVEQLIIRLAESYAKTDPKKAEILRQTFSASKERRVEGKLDELVALLAKDQLFQATKSQAEVHADLLKLLELLQRGDHDKQLADQQRRLKEYVARINRIIKYEDEQRAQTEGDRDPKELIPREEANAGRVGKLGEDIQRTEGKSGGANDNQAEGGKNGSSKDDAGKKDSGKKDGGKGKSGDSKSGDN